MSYRAIAQRSHKTVQVEEYLGNKVLVLDAHSWDKFFSFGYKKAKAFIQNIELIKECEADESIRTVELEIDTEPLVLQRIRCIQIVRYLSSVERFAEGKSFETIILVDNIPLVGDTWLKDMLSKKFPKNCFGSALNFEKKLSDIRLVYQHGFQFDENEIDIRLYLNSILPDMDAAIIEIKQKEKCLMDDHKDFMKKWTAEEVLKKRNYKTWNKLWPWDQEQLVDKHRREFTDEQIREQYMKEVSKSFYILNGNNNDNYNKR